MLQPLTYKAIRHFAAAQVENTFFKVHRYFLVRESEVFRVMFSCPSPGDGQEGMDDGKPIHLPGTTCQQFEALLDFFYEGLFFFQVLVQSSDLESVLDNNAQAHK